MKRIWDILTSIFVSFEFLLVLFLILLHSYFEPQIIAFGMKVNAGPDAVKWLALIPVALLALVFKDYLPLLFPEGPMADMYQRWPRYRMVKDRYVITIIFQGAAAAVAIWFWITAIDFTNSIHFCLFFGAIALATVTFIQFFWAKIALRRLLIVSANELPTDGSRNDRSPGN
jgi:hypothetical protein